jgi:hypothetical protein
MNLQPMMCTRQLTPTTPAALLPTAPIVPALVSTRGELAIMVQAFFMCVPQNCYKQHTLLIRSPQARMLDRTHRVHGQRTGYMCAMSVAIIVWTSPLIVDGIPNELIGHVASKVWVVVVDASVNDADLGAASRGAWQWV